MDMMDPSVCRLHPGVAVTGFCPACLRDRLAGLQPPSSADLRRCKSFSYARSAAAMEPQRRSCDLFRHQQPIVAAVPEEHLDYYQYQDEAAARPHEQDASRKSLGGLLGRKLQQWRRKNKKEPEMPSRQRHRPSCDADPLSGPVPSLGRLPATLLSLSVEEDDDMAPPPVPRSDGQIPVEEDYYYGDGYGNAAAAVPGGTAQTRDYYLDSSSSSRRRRSVDRSTTSGRNSFSDANHGGELPATSRATTATNANGNARVSPAIAAERLYHHHHHYHHEAQSVLVHHQHCRDDDFSGSFGSARHPRQNPASKPPPNKKGIRGWSIWGLLIHKKSSRKQQQQQPEGPFFSSEAAAAGEYPWPELRARGYNGQMLRCNSSMSARSSFSGGVAAMIGGSGRRSISGADMRDVVRDGVERRTRRDEVLLERTRSSSSYSRSGHGLDPNIPRRSSSKHELSSMHRRSTLGL
ncbi:hypothetical protein GQ55_8G264100 [Panicum hallii var. hallii]|uniref:DUF740 domain-containing protein n=1 Tax=Panicum hallii var. hallii TaxID=1504633 RepID=A0A2T7CRG2_9POAL|nr:hypothetical protein GQ55_8G264100 [Panicum hallii var. hallii]